MNIDLFLHYIYFNQTNYQLSIIFAKTYKHHDFGNCIHAIYFQLLNYV